MLHELVTEGLTQYFNELIRIFKDDVSSLRREAQFIVNKINGRNKQDRTPLIYSDSNEKNINLSNFFWIIKLM
jgi:ribulose bisphosphate carboxylase small subunit